MAEQGNSEEVRELQLLEALAEEPETKQVDLATRLEVAVGTVNWLLQRLASKGFVKVKRVGRWRWRYLLTPQGFAEKARLTQVYLQNSMSLYRQTREEARRLLGELQRKGYAKVYLEGSSGNDLLDVCRLTCLEQGVKLINPEEQGDEVPVLRVDGRQLSVAWPKEEIDG